MISEVSKFNIRTGAGEREAKYDILGFPHTEDGYKEAKRILEQTYGKDVKIHKAQNYKGTAGRNSLLISSIHRLKNIHDFYNKLSRVTVQTLITMKRLPSAQCSVYTLMDKLALVRELLVQKDGEWEELGLEELVENLGKYVERNPLKDS